MTQAEPGLRDAAVRTSGGELLVLDPGVEHSEVLLRGLRPGIEVLRLAPGGDALAQIAAVLRRRRGLCALHVVSHGEPGALLLAGERIDLPLLAFRYAALAELAAALAPGGAVLLYGCSIASGPSGRRFVEYLEDILAAPVAAAAGPVGDPAAGGGWLPSRHAIGAPPAQAFAEDVWADYPGLLATFTLTGGDETPPLSAGDDTVTADAVNVLNAGDSINGLGGSDTLAISAAQTVHIQPTTLLGFERINITAGTQLIVADDAMVASGAALRIDATASDDALGWDGRAESDGRFLLLGGGTAADTLIGGGGADTLSGGGGGDQLSGGAGNDVFVFECPCDADGAVIDGAAGHDVIRVAEGGSVDFSSIASITGIEAVEVPSGAYALFADQFDGSTLALTGGGYFVFYVAATTQLDLSGLDVSGLTEGVSFIEIYDDPAHDDRLVGTGLGEHIHAAGGNDSLSGGAGGDTLSGGDGNDLISGGAGDDILFGYGDSDTLNGGAGNDTFVADDGDTVQDWAAGEALVIEGAVGLTAARIARAGDVLSFDSNGDGTADATVTATGLSADASFAVTIDGGSARVVYSVPASGGGGGGGGDGGSGSGGPFGSVVVVDSPPPGGGFGRTIVNNGGSSGGGAIVENTGNNDNLVTATVPTGVSVSAQGPGGAMAAGDASATLLSAIDARDPGGESALLADAAKFLGSLDPGALLDVRTIALSTASSSLTGPVVLSGSSPAGGTQTEAFVIDMRGMPPGTVLQLENIGFAAVIGGGTVTGSGSTHVIGDSSAQAMTLGAGADTLEGGGGSDTTMGGSGADSLLGGDDQDLLYGNQAADLVYGNQGLDTLFGGQDADSLFGGQHEDLAYGNLGGDVLYGNLGADTLYGGAGGDVLYGGRSEGGAFAGTADLLYGNLGDDELRGGQGDDVLYGGGGADRFVAGDGGRDEVADFDAAEGDRIQVEAGAEFDSFEELLAAASDDGGGGVVFALGGGTLRLAGTSVAELQAGWFVLT